MNTDRWSNNAGPFSPTTIADEAHKAVQNLARNRDKVGGELVELRQKHWELTGRALDAEELAAGLQYENDTLTEQNNALASQVVGLDAEREAVALEADVLRGKLAESILKEQETAGQLAMEQAHSAKLEKGVRDLLTRG